MSLLPVSRVFDQASYVPGAQLLGPGLIMQPMVWSAEARQMKPCTPPSTVRKIVVAVAKATTASTEVWPAVPRVPGRWNSRQSANVFIACLPAEDCRTSERRAHR